MTAISQTSEKRPAIDGIDTTVSLGVFQAKYTSEDNESFYNLLDKQNLKRAEKYAWLWNGNKLPSKQQLKQKEIEGEAEPDEESHRRRLQEGPTRDQRQRRPTRGTGNMERTTQQPADVCSGRNRRLHGNGRSADPGGV